ncbi:MAG: GTPase, partial [Pseudomonadota bacterium]|nr:GTPase [Pseudomonadota bacterium]
MKDSRFTIAIVGRPNVGKSTLFNRLAGKKIAIIDDTPGITRDRREGIGRLGDLDLGLFDTAGFEDLYDDSLEARMRAQTDRAVRDADLALFLIDARAGVTPLDEHFANWLRAQAKPVLLIANKHEGRSGEAGRLEAFGLGLGDPIALSAEHGEGLTELYDAILPFVDAQESTPAGPEVGEVCDPAVQLAIVGRPNVGKSTLLNQLIGEDRMLTGPEAGITRDAIDVKWSFEGQHIRLIDTAGLRRAARVT